MRDRSNSLEGRLRYELGQSAIEKTVSGCFNVAARMIVHAASGPSFGHFRQVPINMQFWRAIFLFRLDFRGFHIRVSCTQSTGLLGSFQQL